MIRQPEIGAGLSEEDKEKAASFLRKFLKHIKPGKAIICGGLATRWHLAMYGRNFPKRTFNDLDLLIERSEDIKASITKDFLIYHFHPANPHDRVEPEYFFYAFIDQETGLKADVFPYRWSAPRRFKTAYFEGKPIKVVGIEDQLIQCLYDVSRISSDMKVDPKQLTDVHTLLEIGDRALAERIWKKNAHPDYPKTLGGALGRADRLTSRAPGLVEKASIPQTRAI